MNCFLPWLTTITLLNSLGRANPKTTSSAFHFFSSISYLAPLKKSRSDAF